MTKDQIISQLFTGKNFNDCIRKIEPEHLRDDLRMEVIAIVCEWDEERVLGLYSRKELDFFVVRVILNQIKSNTSPFFRKFRRTNEAYNENEGADETADRRVMSRERWIASQASVKLAVDPSEHEQREAREEIEDKAIQEIDNLYWYNRDLLKLYLEKGNYRAIEKATGIPFISCYKSIQKSINEIRCQVLK